MPQLDLSTRKRIALAYLKTRNYARVAKEFHVDVSTVKLWSSRFEKDGDLRTKPSCGRKRALSQAAARKAVELLRSQKFDGCKQVAVELHKLGLTHAEVHASTVSRSAKAQALADGAPIMAVRTRPTKGITAGTRAKRLAFCKANLKRNWDNVMITDRCKFFFRYPGTSVKRVQWVGKGEQRTVFKPNNPSCVNMYAGITKYGVTKAHLVTGTTKLTTNYTNKKGQQSRNITSSEYQDVLNKTLLPEGQRLLGNNGLTSWYLQQDNDPTHKKPAAAALESWNSRGKGKTQLLAGWPPNSPDLSPIENAWASIQARVDAAGCNTFDEFKETLLKEWANMDRKLYTSLMRSLPNRMQLCVDKDGDKTRY